MTSKAYTWDDTLGRVPRICHAAILDLLFVIPDLFRDLRLRILEIPRTSRGMTSKANTLLLGTSRGMTNKNGQR
jgi:hypothetical protein